MTAVKHFINLNFKFIHLVRTINNKSENQNENSKSLLARLLIRMWAEKDKRNSETDNSKKENIKNKQVI